MKLPLLIVSKGDNNVAKIEPENPGGWLAVKIRFVR